MKRLIKITLSLALTSVILNGCGGGRQSDSIKIGVILPLTGNFAVIGEGEKKGIDMAVDSLRQKFPGKKIEVVYEDFASETKNAVTAANKLISVDRVDAIITSTTAASEAVSPVVERAKKINFVISPDIEVVSKSQYNFRVYYNLNAEAEVVNSFVQKMKPSSASFLASRYSSLEKLVDGKLEPSFKQAGINVLAKEYVEVTDKDFKNSILKIKAGEPAMWFLAPMTNQVDLFTNQLKDYGVAPGGDRIVIGSFTFNWKPASFISTLEGYYIATPVFQTYDESNPFVKAFAERYNAKPSFDVAYAYDNTMILTELLINSNKQFDSFRDTFNRSGAREGASGKIHFVGNNETNAEIVITKVVRGNQTTQF